jgi:hydroxyacylglutathione hydrolase
MSVIPIPQLADNYAYLVVDDASQQAAVVDCAEADTVLNEVKRRGLRLVAVLSTHWHGDHTGGNAALAAMVAGIKIYGARAEGGRIPALTDPVEDGDTIRIGSLAAQVLGIPAHTSGHVAYYFASLKALFSGDTLFIAGCGRVFEGQAATMVASLRKLAALPEDTQVYCGHEYTENNLRFALTVEPNNAALKKKYEWAVARRRENKPTIPSTIGEEKQTNPFLRTDSDEIRAILKRSYPELSEDPVAVFAKLREMKDRF